MIISEHVLLKAINDIVTYIGQLKCCFKDN